jgi:hypothetical protein
MFDYILVCRSLTYAQRGHSKLQRSGFKVNITRTPTEISKEGCGYSIILRQGNLNSAISVMKEAGVTPKRVYRLVNGVPSEEVAF